MAYAFLWIETLVLALVFVAFFYGLTSPLKRRFLRTGIRTLALLLPFVLSGAFTMLAWFLLQNHLDIGWMFGYSLSWLICLIIGCFLLRKYARKTGETGETCCSWRLMNLTGAFGIVLSLCLLTFMKMDADARARLGAAQSRALAQAAMITPEPVDPEQNAARVYEKAGKGINLPPWAFEINKSGFMPDLKESEMTVAENRRALLLIKQASGMPRASFVPDLGVNREWPSFRAALPSTNELRDGVRLLALDCYVKAAHGKAKEAMECIGSMEAAARQCASDPFLISTFVAASIIEAQKTSLERLLALAPSSEPDLIPLPVESRGEMSGLWRRSLLMEEAIMLYSFSFDVATGRVAEGLSDFSTENLLFSVLPYRSMMSMYDLAFFERLYRKTHEFASKPIYQVYQKQKEWEKTMLEKPGGLISAIAVAPQFANFAIKPHVADALSGLMQIALAATAYYARHGDYPGSLDDLAPDYVPKIPLDPFDGKPLKMRGEGRGLVFYSIGPDFKDDGGKMQYPLPYDGKKSGDLLFRMGAAYDKAYLAPALPRLAASGNTEMVRRAIAVGSDINLDIPLVEAALKGHGEVVSLLLDQGADINALKEIDENRKRKERDPMDSAMAMVPGGVTALMGACVNGHRETVSLLLEKGADPNQSNREGRTPLMLAVGPDMLKATAWKKYEMGVLDRIRKDIQVLNAKIAELKKKETDEAEEQLARVRQKLEGAKRRVEFLQNDKTPSQKPVPMQSPPDDGQGRTALVRLLLDAGANIRTKDALGSTALLFAVCQGDEAAAKLLMEKGADVNARNEFGWSALVIAKARGSRPLEALLTGAGAVQEAGDQKAVNLLSNSLSRLRYSESLKDRRRVRKR